MIKTCLSKKVQAIKPSMTSALHGKLIQIQADGKNILNLGIGEPDLNSPEDVKLAAIEAIRNNQTRYTNNRGSLDLLKAIAEYLLKSYGLNYRPEELIASNGAKQALFLALNSVINAGDKLLIFRPFYPSYLQMSIIAGAEILIADLKEENNFRIELEDLQKIDFLQLKAIILNIPSNPTGGGISPSASAYLAEKVLENEITLICDDIYRDIYFSEKAPLHPLLIEPQLKDYTIIINGVSKSCAMTGWRLGYAAGNAEIIVAMDHLQNQVSGHPSSITQIAAIAALKMKPQYSKNLIAHYSKRRDLFLKYLSDTDYLTAVASESTFYQYLNIKWFICNAIVESSLDFAHQLLEAYNIFVMPSEAFGHSGYIRVTLNMEPYDMNYFFDSIRLIAESGKK